MIETQFIRRALFRKSQLMETKAMLFYRYFSLLCTSLFYLTGFDSHTMGRKLFIIVCMGITSVLLSYLYIKNQNMTNYITTLILIEIVGDLLILIPSGGLNSPYVWYSLNPILIAALKLKRKFVWLTLFIYLPTLLISNYILFNEENYTLFELINRNSNLVLSYILITAAIVLLSKYLKDLQNESLKLMEANEELKTANEKIKESMGYIMKLYHTVHIFSAQRDKESLIEQLVQYCRRITNTDMVMFYSPSFYKNNGMAYSKDIPSELADSIKYKLVDQWNNIENLEIPIIIKVENKNFAVMPVKSTYKTYGILAVEALLDEKGHIYKDTEEQLKFLSELSSLVIERSELEKINNRLLIAGEQNRIAEEIHDSALQRLFSISCGIFALMKKAQKEGQYEISSELNAMRDSIDSSIKELRSIIYGLSWKKGGTNTFEADILEYISEIRRFNSVDITFKVSGSQEILSSNQKKAFYRIICEGVSNSIRHGKASSIEVNLEITNDQSVLEIKDNGVGFDAAAAQNKQNGLGIRNIHSLAFLLNGKVSVNSEKGRGSDIKVIIPNTVQESKKEVVV